MQGGNGEGNKEEKEKQEKKKGEGGRKEEDTNKTSDQCVVCGQRQASNHNCSVCRYGCVLCVFYIVCLS